MQVQCTAVEWIRAGLFFFWILELDGITWPACLFTFMWTIHINRLPLECRKHIWAVLGRVEQYQSIEYYVCFVASAIFILGLFIGASVRIFVYKKLKSDEWNRICIKDLSNWIPTSRAFMSHFRPGTWPSENHRRFIIQ